MKNLNSCRLIKLTLIAGIVPTFFFMAGLALAQGKPEKSKFTAVVTDSQGIETELKHVIFYWEEKINETSFVPHELVYLPAKQGNTTYNIKFENIKQIEVKPGGDKSLPSVNVTMANGRSRDFTLAMDGKLKGETDFGDVELPAHGLKKVVFK